MNFDKRTFCNESCCFVVMTTDMEAPWVRKQEISAYDDIDIDELLAQLTPEEIEELAGETDPDVSCLSCLFI